MPDRPVLAFDTSAAHCAAALLCAGEILAARAESMAKGQAERLVPMLEELLEDAGCNWRDLGRIGVGVGPGNFTGIRLSVAAARGMALALEVPALGVTGFEAAALDLPRPCRVAIPAMRGQVYLQRFGVAGPGAPQLVPAEAAGGAMGPPDPVDLATAIARIAATRPLGSERPTPLYIRPADAAPPREAPPKILP